MLVLDKTLDCNILPPCLLQRNKLANSQGKIQQDATKYQSFIIPYLYKAQHVSGDTLPIIRNLKLHWQPLVFSYV
jgi:hypothetical protein